MFKRRIGFQKNHLPPVGNKGTSLEERKLLFSPVLSTGTSSLAVAVHLLFCGSRTIRPIAPSQYQLLPHNRNYSITILSTP